MLHSGSGATQIKNFLSCLEIEGVHHTTMKKRELEVEPHLASVTMQSCSDILAKEINLNKNSTNTEETPGAAFKYDMGWQKRGSGRAYDSKSGVGTVLGSKTGKICAFGIRSKDCRKCSFHQNLGKVPPKHNCLKNWTGSSKAMESDVAVESIKNIEIENIQVSTVIMDDDTTTMAKIQQSIPHPVVKWSDINHTKKHLGTSLYILQKKHKRLSTGCIKYFQSCFGHAVAQNKGNSQGLEKSLRQIVPHAFGNHEHCDNNWCAYHENPSTYKHKYFAYGRDLSGEELEVDLTSLLETFIRNVDKISPGESTRDVESFNNMIASKAPKRCHYSASSALKNRVNCAVAEKNIGTTYVNQVNSSVGVSPGRLFEKHALKKDKIRKRRLLYENTKAFKKRKIEKKLMKSSSKSQIELREGITYQSAVGFQETNANDVTEIPCPKLAPLDIEVKFPEQYLLVYCDIETTSLSLDCDIIQIAAVANLDCFSEYILPSQPISPVASQVTGLVLNGNVLFYQNKPVRSISLNEALALFLAWLNDRKPCVLIGHNIKTFDFPRLLCAFEKCHLLPAFHDSVVGIVDTLPLFRNLFPAFDKHNQEHLVTNILGQSYIAHNAKEDVISLQKLVVHINPSIEVMSIHSSAISFLLEKHHFERGAQSNMTTLAELYDQKILTKPMALKVARSGLQLCHLKLAISRGGVDGLAKLFSENITGKPRVTKSKKIVIRLHEYLTKKT